MRERGTDARCRWSDHALTPRRRKIAKTLSATPRTQAHHPAALSTHRGAGLAPVREKVNGIDAAVQLRGMLDYMPHFVRQVALVAAALESVVSDLCAVFGLEVSFNDPGVEVFGLHNAVMPVGDTFLEVVSPLRPDASAARYRARRGGDSGYMVILQTDDLAADRQRLAGLGVRIVWETALPDIATIHLHPRDVGGAIVSLDQPLPSQSWRWAGPDWEAKRHTECVRSIISVDIQSAEPEKLARRWGQALGLSAVRRGEVSVLPLSFGQIRMLPVDDARGEGVVAVELAVADEERVRAAAAARGRLGTGGVVSIGGVDFRLSPSLPALPTPLR